MLNRPKDLADQLSKRYERNWGNWLAGEGDWPLSLKIGSVQEQDWADAGSGIAGWKTEWQAVKGSPSVIWIDKHFSHRGKLRVPVRIEFSSPTDLAAWIGKSGHRNKAKEVRCRFMELWPEASAQIDLHLATLLQLGDEDLDRMAAVVGWLVAHPASGLFRRELPVRGVDTKWLEKFLSIVVDFVTVIAGTPRTGDQLSDIGLQGPPRLIRWRFLSNELRKQIGGIGSLTTPIDDLGSITVHPTRVIVIENLETMLALPDIEGAMTILGAGYAVDSLGRIPWLAECQVLYWGDIDTHGFAILNRARSYIPGIESILMGRDTLLEHEDLWSFESDQHRAESLEFLSPEEALLFEDLRRNRLGIGVRLEQERIPLRWAYSKVLAVFRTGQGQ